MGVHAGEDVGRGEEKVVGLPAAGHFVPRDRGRHGGAAPGAQRVGGDGGLGAVVLAPVDEHLACAQRPGHPGHHLAGVLLFHPLGQRLRPRAGLLGRQAADRRVQLQALAARGLGQRPQALVLEQRAEFLRHPAAVHHRGRQPGVEVEDEQIRFPAGKPPHRDVQLEAGQVGRPDQRRQVIDDQVADRGARLPRPRAARLHVLGTDPVRPVGGRVLGEERLGVDAFRVALERHRPARDVRQQHGGDPLVVVEHLGLGEPVRRVQHLRQVAQRQGVAVDLHRNFVHYVSLTTSAGSLSSRSP